MSSWVKWIGAGAIGLFASAAIAADHGDGAATAAAPAADITDVFAWLKDDGQTLVLIQNVSAMALSDSVQYVFHVGRRSMALQALTGPAQNWTDIICEVEGTAISCWVGDQSYVTGTPPANGSGITNDDGVKVHAGQHADPFYFFLDGFGTTIATVNAVAAGDLANLGADPTVTTGNAGYAAATSTTMAVFDPTSPCNTTVNPPPPVTVGGLLRGMLNGTYSDANCAAGTAVDNFASGNVSSIVMEVPLSLIEGSGDYVQVWASTHNKP